MSLNDVNVVDTTFECPNCGSLLKSMFMKDGSKMSYNSKATLYCNNHNCEGFDAPIEQFTDKVFTA